MMMGCLGLLILTCLVYRRWSAAKAPHYVENAERGGQIYTGFRLGHKMHGKGTLYWRKESRALKYTGGFQDGLRHGYGTFWKKDGSSYQGTWTKGCRDGFGVFVCSGGYKRYEGEIKMDVFTGKGIYSWHDGKERDGDVYIGEFVKHLKHGFGVYNYKDGSKYEGPFLEDRKHGLGVYTDVDGKRQEQTWLNGTLIG